MNTRSWGAGLLAFCLSATGCLAAQSEPIHAAADWHSTVRQVAREHFKNPAWGFSHCERDYALARSLAATDHVALDDDVLFAAASCTTLRHSSHGPRQTELSVFLEELKRETAEYRNL